MRALQWFLAVVAGGSFLCWFLTRPVALAPGELPVHQPDAARGETFFHAGGCASCHEASLEGGQDLNSGFGTFRVPNISPDPSAGIGGWSTLEFVNAMMFGVSPDGRHYYPSFPYPSYARMDVRDVIDLKAYLDTLTPQSNVSAEHDLGFPWNLRRGIGLWKLRDLDADMVVAVDSADPLAQKGRYLVEGPGYCGECHTPRDRWGGPELSRWLAGGPNPDGEGRVPNITPGEDGLESWSESDIAYYLESGFLPDFDMVGGAMVDVQENMARLTDSDREAIARYLKSVPAQSTRKD